MKIAYIVPSLAAKGPVIVVRDLSELMTLNGHQCVVYYFDKIIEMTFSCQTKRIDGLIKFTDYDIVHSHGIRPDKYVYKYREWSGKVKYITTLHNYIIQDFKYQYNWFVAQTVGRYWIKMLNRMDKIVTLTADAVNYYLRWLPSHKVTYIYNSRILLQSEKCDKHIKNIIKGFKEDSVLIGINALLTHRKGVDQIIKALPFLPNHKLFIAGDGKVRKELENLACRMQVRERCYFAGYVKDAYKYMEYYDIYMASSRSEGFPLILLEAAQYKIPTVCSKIPVFEEVFSPEEVAFFELDNIPSLVNAIKNVPDGIKMFEKYSHNYTPDKMYNEYLKVYSEF